jgi:hypothetical protein
MELDVGFFWLGALLVILGVLLTATKALFRGRLSEARQQSQASADRTLEPREAGNGLSLKTNRAPLALIVIGCLLLLGGAIL